MRIHLPSGPSVPRRCRPALLVLLLEAAALLGCMPELPLPPDAPPPGDVAQEGGDRLELVPPAPLDAAPQAFRARLRLPAGADVDLERVLLIEGKVGKAHLRQIVRDEISKALSERIVPSLSWIEQGDQGEPVVVLAPSVPLRPGESYAVASGAPEWVEHIQVAEEAPPPLPRLWPPPGLAATAAFGIWCGGEAEPALPAWEAPAALAPEGPAGVLRRGVAGEIGRRCLRFEADGGAAGEGPWVGPPAIELGGALVGLDPRPFVVEAPPPEPAAAACEAEEAPFGPGCAAVADDRILVRSADAPTLWAVGGEGLDLVVAAGPGEPFLVAPLPPLSAIRLEVVTADAAGQAAASAFAAVTLPPMPHVIINEVLANPVGPEPMQEWVELYNDGLVSAPLGLYVIADVGGETALPEAELPPRGYALVVNEEFSPDGELDPAPAPGALVLRVPRLGKSGLANGGEPIRLRDGHGRVVSRAPPLSAPKPGMSLSRISPRSPDGVAGSFVAGWPTPGRENILETP